MLRQYSLNVLQVQLLWSVVYNHKIKHNYPSTRWGLNKHRIVVRSGQTGTIVFWALSVELALKWIKRIPRANRNLKGYSIEYWDEPARLSDNMSIAMKATIYRDQKQGE